MYFISSRRQEKKTRYISKDPEEKIQVNIHTIMSDILPDMWQLQFSILSGGLRSYS